MLGGCLGGWFDRWVDKHIVGWVKNEERYGGLEWQRVIDACIRQLLCVEATKLFCAQLKELCEKFHAFDFSHMLYVQDKKKPERHEILALHKHMDCLERYSAGSIQFNTPLLSHLLSLSMYC